MPTSLAVSSCGLLVAVAPLWAEPGPITLTSVVAPAALVELYTSEGCSSCPPADAWISKLKTDPGLWRHFVPVVFHVDYWNGLGWPDRFSSSANTARQRRYAAAWRSESVYTPGLVLDGHEWRDWSRTTTFPTSTARGGVLTVTVNGSEAEVTFAPEGSTSKTLQVEVALLGNNLESDVRRGENSGHRLRHDFTVLSHRAVPLQTTGHGRFTAHVSLPPPATDVPSALAAWVTPGDALPPLQATGGWLQTR